ncbi:MAG TPA: DUF2240 family protein [Candidatus Thermoplasmatota archaeon]|nr:DUF2240 family protein [Candidatus Thermoplasmatota archaeon]
MSDLRRALAYVFRRKGETTLPKTVFKQSVTFDLHWFAPEQTKKLLEHALAVGALVADGDHVRPAFNVATIEVPMGFRPTEDILSEIPEPDAAPAAPALYDELVAAVAAAIGETPAAVAQAASEVRARAANLLAPEVALLEVARARGADPRAWTGRVREALVSTAKR